MKTRKNSVLGFTLIELMIVISIIAILASIAIVSYKRNIAQTQVSEAMTMLGFAKTSIDDGISQDGAFPNDLEFDALGINQTGKYVSDITADQATNTIYATFNTTTTSGLIAGKTLNFVRDPATGVWLCTITAETIADAALPKICE